MQNSSPEPKRSLYAVAVEIPIKRRGKIIGWKPEITHLHAFDSQNAKVTYLQDPDNYSHRIVAVGPVVGYFVEDNHGEVLSA